MSGPSHARVGITTASPEARSCARERSAALREVPQAERVRLRSGFGAALRAERGFLTQRELAERCALSRRTIERLETGVRRPTSTSIWKIVLALRPRGSMYERVALDQRLREAAGDSFRDYSRRPHTRREAVRAELLAEAAGRSLAEDPDTLGTVVVTAMARLWAGEGAV